MLIPVSIPLWVAAKRHKRRAERSIPGELPGDTLMGHLEAYNQWTAEKLEATPDSIGERVKAPTVKNAVNRAVDLGELARDDD